MPKIVIHRSVPKKRMFNSIIEHPAALSDSKTQSDTGRQFGEEAISDKHHREIFSYSDHVLNGIRVAARLSPNYNTGDFVVMYNDKVITIDKMGSLSEWPKGMADQILIDLKILGTGKE